MEAGAQGLIENNDLLKCIQCGVCTGSCPVSVKSSLNIRRVMRDIVFSGNVSIPSRDELWSCTTCSTCEVRCPKGLTPFDLIVDMRGLVIEEGRVEPTIRDALESVFKHGNPWGRARSRRSDWAEGLQVEDYSESADILYHVGCSPAYDPRCQDVAKAMIKVLNSSGLRYGTLGNDENCCGSSVFGMGEKGLFELLIEDNLELFESNDVGHVVTTSPHCYNTFKNRYGDIGFSVQHYTELFAELIDSGKINFTGEVEKTLTYHDPCFLGRKNNIYDEPRKILESLPGAKLVEMTRSRERSLCCEGGGGRMWIDIPGERLSERRVNSAIEIGAEILATACPFCLSTLEDAVLTSDNEGSIEIFDIVELVSKAL